MFEVGLYLPPVFKYCTLLNTGGKYNPTSNIWVATSTTNAPTGLSQHTAVWTGSLMIVWGDSIRSPFEFRRALTNAHQ